MSVYKDAYPERGGSRITMEQTQACIAQKTGSTPVDGFGGLVRQGDAIAGGFRTAGYMECGASEWLIPLSARKNFAWKTEPVPAHDNDKVAFVLAVGFGNGSPLPQSTGQWDIYCNDRFAVSVRVVNHSQLWQAGECSFAFAANRIEAAEPYGSLTLSEAIRDEAFAAFGPALLTVPASWVEPGGPATITVEAKCEQPSTRWFQITSGGPTLRGSDIYRAVELLTDERVPRADGYNVYFGDIHTHSGQWWDEANNQGCGMGSRASNYEYARGAGALDFYTLSEHEWQVDPARNGEFFALADEYQQDGRFICLPGFEFTSLVYGHRNVYFRNSSGTILNAAKQLGGPTFDANKSATPMDLWAAMEATGVDFITVPHHTSSTSHPCSMDFYNPKYDRLIEVYSSWGSSEYYGDFPRGVSDRFRTLNVRDALAHGFHMGMIASSDGHDGHPGNAQSPYVKHHHMYHFLGSGRAAVLAPELTRDAVFDALHDRRCYATTGTPIVLSFSVDGNPMGSELPALPQGVRPKLSVGCRGTNGIDHIRIVKNGRVVHTQPCHGEFTADLEWEDPEATGSGPNYYYVRVVQIDRESAWSSPVWIG